MILYFNFMMRVIVAPGLEFKGSGDESLMFFVHRTGTITNLLTVTHLNTGIFLFDFLIISGQAELSSSPALNPLNIAVGVVSFIIGGARADRLVHTALPHRVRRAVY
ncbi:hypothetical protein F4604DRAFT_1021541 [Suillus subluteus]|nr:hypothetical protein F4604DRAFT_1021541 [Suillus subluteus]